MTQTMVDTEVIKAAVDLACRAPSLHNSQPWRWVAGGAAVDLFADPHRVVAWTDGSGRQAIIGCGAVLDHFRAAMAAAGWETHVDEFPNPNNPDHLASIDFSPADYVAAARRDRAAAISVRRTDRRPFRAPRDWSSFEPVLRSALAASDVSAAFDTESVILEVLPDDARPRLVEASRLSEALRRYDDDYHQELSWWTAPSRELEGIPESALPSDARGRGIDVNRRFPSDAPVGRAADTRHATHVDEAKIVALSTPGDTRADALHAGQALSAALLECTMARLATCTVTHITELEAARDVIRELLSGGEAVPQLLIRVGIEPNGPGAPGRTPRRPLHEVLQIRR